MSIDDWLHETVIPVKDVPAEIPSRPRTETVWRWTTSGCHGHVLETFRIGSRRFTSKEAIHRFLAALNSKSRNPAGGGFSNPNRREQERVERELDALGL